LKEYAKVLMHNDVVEHVFYHEWIGGGNGTHGTHYYITRGRAGARKREKDAEERNNKITVELQQRKRQQEERDKKMI
jgi:negative regulator of genetic competence, sporulation and motility